MGFIFMLTNILTERDKFLVEELSNSGIDKLSAKIIFCEYAELDREPLSKKEIEMSGVRDLLKSQVDRLMRIQNVLQQVFELFKDNKEIDVMNEVCNKSIDAEFRLSIDSDKNKDNLSYFFIERGFSSYEYASAIEKPDVIMIVCRFFNDRGWPSKGSNGKSQRGRQRGR